MTVATPESPVVSSVPGMAPALVGTYRRNQVVHIPCPAWCDQDHMDTPYALEDIDHYSGMVGWSVDSILDPGTAVHEMYARVHSDPSHDDPRMRAAHVAVGNGAPIDAYLAPEMADASADELIAFALRMKEAARVARAANKLMDSQI